MSTPHFRPRNQSIGPITVREILESCPEILESCPHDGCGAVLDLHQVDDQNPDRLVGVCTSEDCSRWYLLVRPALYDRFLVVEIPSSSDVMLSAESDRNGTPAITEDASGARATVAG